MDKIIKTIGTIQTPYNSIKECPNNIQHNGPLCTIKLDKKYRNGLLGLKTGQSILVLYWFEGVNRSSILQNSSDGNHDIGVFALRSPHRPNPIATAILSIVSIDQGLISVKGLDCKNGTKLLDIKPAIMNELES